MAMSGGADPGIFGDEGFSLVPVPVLGAGAGAGSEALSIISRSRIKQASSPLCSHGIMMEYDSSR